MKTCYAVLLDTISIQKYVFSSNRLKENLGASYLVQNIYKGFMKQALNFCLGKEPDLTAWGKEPDTILMDDPHCTFEVGYVGGGNALLLFREKDTAKNFIRVWTRELLIQSPGLQPAVAIAKLETDALKDPNMFREFIREIHAFLTENKNRYFANTVLPKHGITADCPLSGYSADIFSGNAGEQGQFISSVSHAKFCAAVEANKEIAESYKELLVDKFRFSDLLGELGQVSGDSYLAVVHIDGNSMADRFRQVQGLPAMRELSRSVKKATENAFIALLNYIIAVQMEHLEDSELFSVKTDKDGRNTLPIRPIVLGGDDITFVTDGRLGIHFAEKFIDFFEKQPVSDEQPLTACAGVAIVKTKFPFYRAYEMAEQLCSEAKKVSKTFGEPSSWLDCQIFYSGMSGALGKIRKDHYQVDTGKLNFSPYLLSGDDYSEKHIETLKNGIRYFLSQWPRSKRKDLRQALTQGMAGENFYLDMKARGLHLPQIKGRNYHLRGWENSVTPYFDMVELLEFFPGHCL